MGPRKLYDLEFKLQAGRRAGVYARTIPERLAATLPDRIRKSLSSGYSIVLNLPLKDALALPEEFALAQRGITMVIDADTNKQEGFLDLLPLLKDFPGPVRWVLAEKAP